MCRSLRTLVLLGFCLLVGAALPAQTTQKLSLDEAIRMAQTSSFTATASQARVLGANARLRGAGTLANPSLSLQQPFGKDTGALDQDVMLTQTIELGDKLRQRVRSARAEREAALADKVSNRLELAYNAQSAYFEALRSDAEQRDAAEALANAQTFAKTAAIQFQAGDVARSNVLRSQIEVTRAEQTLTAAETERANRYATLRSLLGLPEAAPLELTDTLSFVPVTYELQTLQALAARNRPDILAAQKLRDSREANLHGTRVAAVPDFVVQAVHGTLDPTSGGNTLSVGFLLPLFDFGRNRADTASARAALDEQTATVNETIRLARLDVETAARNLEQARKTVLGFQGGRLDRAKELLSMAQLGYNRGATSFLELLDAQQVYRAEQTEYARALADYNIAKAALQRAVGGTLPQ